MTEGSDLSLAEQPETHPLPNLAQFVSRSLPEYVLKRNSHLFRIHDSEFGAIYFGRGNSRFQDPRAEDRVNGYGILYAALATHIAFRETVVLGSFSIVIAEALQQKSLSKLSPLRDLKLVDLSGDGLAQIGADGRLTTLTTENYQIPKLWSRAFYEHPDNMDGIYYRSRYNPSGFCVALYENRLTAADFQEERVTTNNLLDRSFEAELKQILARYGYQRDDDDNPAI